MPDKILKKSLADGQVKRLRCLQVFEPEERTKDGDTFWSYRFRFIDEQGTIYSHYAAHGEYLKGRGGGDVPLREVAESDELEVTKVPNGKYTYLQWYRC